METSIFLDFLLPNAASWFYFSLLLTIALFFQFTRPLSIRNLDLLMLFALVPGFLLLQEAAQLAAEANALTGAGAARLKSRATHERTFGYGWLLAASLYWFMRMLLDMALIRRPLMNTNLNLYGLSWLGIALLICLTAVAVRRTPDQLEKGIVGKQPASIEHVQETATVVVHTAQRSQGTDAPPAAARFLAERGLAMVCHTAVIFGLVMIGWWHFGDLTTGVGTATLYTLLPFTAYNVGQVHHIWPTAFVVWAIFAYRRAAVSGWLLGIAAGTSVFPVLLFPVWFGFYSGRGASRFGLAFLTAAALSVGLTAMVLWIDAPAGWNLVSALHLSEWKPWKAPDPTTESIWTGAHWAYRVPVFVLFVGFLVSGVVWPARKNLSHLIALSAAVLIGVQFWHIDRGGQYVLWYLPFVLMVIFRPTLTAAEPPPVVPGSLLARWAGAAWRMVRPAREPQKPLAV
ncbi:MAG: hypothetical protein RMJ56_00075 [Gemmataceae bacterium]|nr:hypothetical protein [Gemmata sp.]MDW8195977.1 hypothetical protein [Gemmataceae bacterium]